ncbi:hypothetical protein [Pelagibius marinus]|uniref:hypothetical protein n=1 Tax=Pelagibius marinus TaxID=2762760 RepID=UPI0018729AE2|nr:hypothetical protein [Pelagibius marinus]
MINSFSASKLARVIHRALFVSPRVFPTLAILFYFCGWQYVGEYFSQFGIRSSDFDLDEYTFFLYTFNVLIAVPSLIPSQLALVASAVGVLIVGLSSPLWISLLPPKLPRLLLIRLLVWTGLIVVLVLIGQAVGRKHASAVLAGEARQVNVFFTKDATAHFVENLKEGGANQRFEAIRRASELGGLALIWRSDTESIFLQYETQGDLLGEPREIFRVNNRHIFMTVSRPEN